MPMLSDDDLNLRDLTDEEIDRAWDLWFDLAQATNEWDPAYSHGVFAGLEEKTPDERLPIPLRPVIRG
ncbi:MAG: hypothetical protein HY048_07110 [Acidobacteria bacterium]|nr:hypothetical protein [Acidobacteriota bacterium]